MNFTSSRYKRTLELVLLMGGLSPGLVGCAAAQSEHRPVQALADTGTNEKQRGASDRQTSDAEVLLKGANRAFALQLEGARRGDSDMQAAVGRAYMTGEVNGLKGIAPVDYQVAFKWLALAAQQGQPLGALGLGQLYSDGLGVQQDYEAALKWFVIAAEGTPSAYPYLWRAYRDGLGTRPDPEKAWFWERKDLEARRPQITR